MIFKMSTKTEINLDKPIHTFVIDRSKWGKGALYSDGKMCALGFLGKSLGIPLSTLRNTGMPLPHGPHGKKWAKVGLIKCVEGHPVLEHICTEIVGINDSKSNHETREARLREKFKQKNIKVIFKGKYTK